MRFEPPPHRDAHAAIRGYVYQVDRTIQRWIKLGQDEVLQLECGEDIDLIRGYSIGEAAEPERVLEQVKHIVGRSVTLNSPPVLATIANTALHMKRNPGANLRAHFATNASIGRERTRIFRSAEPGLVVWQRMQTGALRASEGKACLTALRKHLVTRSRPKAVPRRDWLAYRKVVQRWSNAELLDFVQRLTWGTGMPDAEDLQSQIEEALVRLGLADEPDAALELYQRLFLHVFKLLGRAGPKLLSREDLQQQLELSPLTDADRAVLREVTTRLRAFAAKVAALEADAKEQRERAERHEAQLRDHGRELDEQRETLDALRCKITSGISRSLLQQGVPPGEHSVAASGQAPVAPSPGYLSALVEAQAIASAEEGVGPVEATFELLPRFLHVEPPPLVEPRTERAKAVSELASTIESGTWTAILGTAGCGKTQLANLTVRTLSCRCVWVTLRSLRPSEAYAVTIATLSGLGGEWPGTDNDQALREVVLERIGAGSVIVLDDLPRFGQDRLEELLTRLAVACHESGARILSTSPYRLPSTLWATLPLETGAGIVCPKLTGEEADEMLEALGAPADLISAGIARLLNSIAGQHPQMLRSIAEYLDSVGWSVDLDRIRSIWSRERSLELTDETLTRILATVGDPKSRDLLYRLNLVIGTYTAEDAMAIAQVEPALPRPGELLHSLLGLWVQEEAGSRYSQSPLVRQLGASDVGEATRRQCCRALGERVVRRGRITLAEASTAVMYFMAAGDHVRAACILGAGLTRLWTAEETVDDMGLLLFWTDSPLPEGLPLGAQLHMRGLQLGLMDRLGRHAAYVRRDLLRLVSVAPEESVLSFLSAAVPASRVLAKTHPLETNSLLRKLFVGWAKYGVPPEAAATLELEEPPEYLVWLHVQHLRTIEDLLDWVGLLEALTPEQRAKATTGEMAASGSKAVMESLWLKAHALQGTVRTWQDYIHGYSAVAERVLKMGLHVLWAFAVRAQIVIHAENLWDLPSAVALGEEALAIAGADPCTEFLVRECMGRQCFYHGQKADALRWLRTGLKCANDRYLDTRADALVTACAAAAAQGEMDEATAYGREAVSTAESCDYVPSFKLVEALGELALCLWRTEGLTGAFPSIEHAANQLLERREDDEHRRRLFALLGHVTGYLASIAREGAPPEADVLGGEYVEPWHGWFLNYNAGLASLYDPSRDCFLCWQVSQIANGAGRLDDAERWAFRALQMAQDVKQRMVAATCASEAMPSLVGRGKLAEALQVAYESSKCIVGGSIRRIEGCDPLEFFLPNFEAEKALGPEGGQHWRRVADATMALGMVPCLCYVCSGLLERKGGLEGAIAQLRGVCREWASEGWCGEEWQDVDDSLDTGFVRRDFAGVQQRIRDRKEQGWWLAGPVDLLAYAHGEAARLAQVATYHISVLQFATGYCQPTWGIQARLVLPYICAYWIRAFGERRFRFRLPELVASDIERLDTVGVGQRAQFLLGSVARSLGLPLTADTRLWLYGTSESDPATPP